MNQTICPKCKNLDRPDYHCDLCKGVGYIENTVYNTGQDTWQHGEQMINDWHKYLGPCPSCGSRTFNYGGGWRCVKMYCFNNASNPIGNLGPAPNWWNKGIQVIKDGDAWCAHDSDFINLHDSNSGWGENPNQAIVEYLKTLELV